MKSQNQSRTGRVFLIVSTAFVLTAVSAGLLLRGLKTEGRAELADRASETLAEAPWNQGASEIEPEGGGVRPSPSGPLGADVDPATVAWLQSRARLKYLDQCAVSESCDFNHESPAAYQVEVQAQLNTELREFTELVRARMEQGRSVPDEAQAIGRYFVMIGADDVKLTAIELLALAPPNPDNLNAVLSGIERSSSAILTRAGLQESERYIDTPLRSEIEAFQLNAIARGPHAVQLEAARNGEFMCGERAGDFAALEQRADPRSPVRQYLELNREECRHRRQGG